MNIPEHVQILAGIIALTSIGSVLLLVVLTMHLLRGRIRAALRTTIAAGVLGVVAFAAALPLGLAPIAHIMPAP